MATPFSAVLGRAQGRYGLPDAADDPLLSNQLFLDRVNEVLQEAAEECRAFRKEFSVDLSGTDNPQNAELRIPHPEGTMSATHQRLGKPAGGGQECYEVGTCYTPYPRRGHPVPGRTIVRYL